MSYSMKEPDWPDVCECTYDEVRDEMCRENCRLHYDLDDESPSVETIQPARKPPASVEADDPEEVVA